MKCDRSKSTSMYQITNPDVDILSRHGINLHFKLEVENNQPQVFQLQKQNLWKIIIRGVEIGFDNKRHEWQNCHPQLSKQLALASTMSPNASEPNYCFTYQAGGRQLGIENFKMWNSRMGWAVMEIRWCRKSHKFWYSCLWPISVQRRGFMTY